MIRSKLISHHDWQIILWRGCLNLPMNLRTVLGNIMSRKKLIMIGMVAGSIAGGYAPSLFGVDGLMTSLLGSTAGGLLGIWIAYRFL